jgi:hypothetical protein
MKSIPICGFFASVVLAGCGGGSPQLPVAQLPAAQVPMRGAATPDAVKKGLYVSAGNAIYGYRVMHGTIGGLVCTLHGLSYPGPLGVDAGGNLMVSDGGARSVTVYKGPKMCGRELGTFADPYGQPTDVSSNDAATGPIAVANIFDVSSAGSVSVCTMQGGCTQNLTNANMYEVAGVVMSHGGDCWASATNSLGTATLTYFKTCSGAGMAATGFRNTYYGGLDIDAHGNLLAIDAFTPALWVYKGCRPKCTLVAGPMALIGDSVFGHLNKNSTIFATADYALGQVDVYQYTPRSLTYQYSFTPPGSGSSAPEGVAFNPRSQ